MEVMKYETIYTDEGNNQPDRSFLSGLANLEHLGEDAKIGKRCELQINLTMDRGCEKRIQFTLHKDGSVSDALREVANLLESEKTNLTDQEF